MLKEISELKDKINELRPLEDLNLQREKIQPRLDYVAQQEEELERKLADHDA